MTVNHHKGKLPLFDILIIMKPNKVGEVLFDQVDGEMELCLRFPWVTRNLSRGAITPRSSQQERTNGFAFGSAVGSTCSTISGSDWDGNPNVIIPNTNLRKAFYRDVNSIIWRWHTLFQIPGPEGLLGQFLGSNYLLKRCLEAWGISWSAIFPMVSYCIS